MNVIKQWIERLKWRIIYYLIKPIEYDEQKQITDMVINILPIVYLILLFFILYGMLVSLVKR